MLKKTIASGVMATLLLLSSATPALAQDNSNPNNQGLLGAFAQLFSKILGQQNGPVLPNGSNQNSQNRGPKMMGKEASQSAQMEESRLNGLVQAGKITEVQKQAILTELTKIKQEITTWSQTTGIDPAYIYGGLRGPGMDAGIGQGGMPNGQDTQMMRPGTQRMRPPQGQN
jgi:hypothetical protein